MTMPNFHMEELARRIGALRHAVEKEYALSEKQRSARGIESYSIELGQAEKDYQDLLDSAGSGNHHQDSGPQMAPSAAEIQPLLPADTALLEFVVGKQSVTELLMTSHAIFGLPIRVSSEALFSRTELLRGLIDRKSTRLN